MKLQKGVLYINFGTGREKVFVEDEGYEYDYDSSGECSICPECEAQSKMYGNISVLYFQQAAEDEFCYVHSAFQAECLPRFRAGAGDLL